jgi:hypothetical protein
MLKTAFLTLLTLVIAIGGGTASLWYVLRTQDGVGAVAIGGWTAFPDIGTPNADPYSKARVARQGSLSLGRAEGLAFAAERDTGGALLRRECSYRIEGSTVPARFWTLYAADRAGRVVHARDGRVQRQAQQFVVVEDGVAHGQSPYRKGIEGGVSLSGWPAGS